MSELSKEADRLIALRQSDLLDTAPDPRFDNITALASDIFNVDVALISLVDENRQWFKSNCGLDDVTETSREEAFCAYAIQQTGILVVEDASQDERFATNSLVTGETELRFYAGAPLITKDGHAFGTLCLIDSEPRTFSSKDRQRLASLAEVVNGLIENHILARELVQLKARLKE
ncbi:MAG: histidine kinase [Ponticaulis sp.]|nr:histidine kinase [Ponticaulis sp.]